MLFSRAVALRLALPTILLVARVALGQAGTSSLVDIGPGTRAYAINEAGQVAGCISTEGGSTHAFRYEDGTLTDLGTLGGENSCALALNASGQVTGYAETATERHAFLYSNEVMADLSAVSGVPTSYGYGINSAGDVVGAAPRVGGSADSAFLYSNGVVTALFPPNGADDVGYRAYAVNNNGLIAGDIIQQCGIVCPLDQPFTQENGVTTYLPLPPGQDGGLFYADITGINAAGQIVASGLDPAGFSYGVLYSNGTPLELGLNTTADAINSAGDVVGNSDVPRLGSPLDPGVGVFLYSARVVRNLNLPGMNPTGINDDGWIVGNHVVLDHAYVLRPSSMIVAPTGLAFGTDPISVASSKSTPACGSCAVTLTNTSPAALPLGEITATSPYSVTHDCPAALPAGASCSVGVTLIPQELGPQPGALTVVAGSTTYASLLSGTAEILFTLTAGTPVVGQGFTVMWQAGTGATCTGAGGSWVTAFNGLAASGSAEITEAVAGTYSYSLECFYGANGRLVANAQLSVVVAPEPPPPTPPSSGGGGVVNAWLLAVLALAQALRRRLIQRGLSFVLFASGARRQSV